MSEIHFDNDKALIIAHQLMSSDIDYKWAISNPVWFLAVRDEDILQIHDKLWVKKRGTTFAQYVNNLRKIELEICDANKASTFLTSKGLEILRESTDARTKFYRYYLALLFTPGLRLIDVVKKKMYCWNSTYFTKLKFKNVFEKSIDSRKVREFALLQPTQMLTAAIDPYENAHEKSRLYNLVNEDILNQLVVDKQLLKSPACKPLKFVYTVGWREEDRLLSKHHYKT